ncbi:MAG: HlyD family efflux transporter periplasmic adaptor subunit [Verrucomicrobiota bacterium]|nr:HlyD family efflux transporter periplasmic adaptor subunit [Verrucomicrobiota bacterium]
MALPVATALLTLSLFAGCARPERSTIQGYVEGEFVYIASPLAGALETLPVQRGAQVKAGDPLFALECGSEKAARDQAERRLAEARANLDDAKKGKRQPEIDAIAAQLAQARAALALSENERARQMDLLRSGAGTAQEFDRARSREDQDRQRVSQLEADLKTAQLGARADQVAAAEANVRALEAALAKADWDLAQKRQCAPHAGLIFDTLYRPGESVAAGRPVVVLLPPQNIKVRAFVPEPRIGAIHPGDRVRILVDGVSEPFAGSVSFISPRAEYTPPVIYSQESRGKLVFMIEAVFDSATAAQLHPGQPVDVQLEP